MVKICIALATYNGEKYLSQMLDSLVAQTRPADMIFAVDDGSKDSSPKILESYRDRLPLTIEVHDVNGGHRAAFSRVLELARTQLGPDDLIALADQDDIWIPNKLEILEKELCSAQDRTVPEQAYPSLVFGDAEIIDGQGQVTADSWRALGNIDINTTIRHQIAGVNHVTGCLCLFKACLLNSILPIPEGVTVHDRWIAMIAEKNGGVKAIPNKVIQYRIHGENAIGGQGDTTMTKTIEIQNKWISTILKNKDLLKLTQEEVSFAERLLLLTRKRQVAFLLPGQFCWVFRNRKYLFLRASFLKTLKRVLFTLVGLPMAKKIWGKE